MASRRSTDSSAESPRSSVQTSRSSAQTPSSAIYSPRSSVQTYRTPESSPHSSAQPPYAYEQALRSSIQTPHSSTYTPRSSDGAPRFSAQTSRSSEGAPISPRKPSRYDYLHPPPADIPYDIDAWEKHDALLRTCFNSAAMLDRKAHLAEKRWKAAEALVPLSRIHEAGIPEKVRTLQEISGLIYRVNTLYRRDRRWRKDWVPRTPHRKYPAWGSCYAECVGVLEGEGVEPWGVVVGLDRELQDLRKRFDEL
jgi:hypothetical protein